MGGDRNPDGVSVYQASEEDLQGFKIAGEQLAEFSAPVLLSGSNPNERLFVAAFDGTGNSRFSDAPENHTNVARIYEQVDRYGKSQYFSVGESTIAAGYVEGVGTQGGLSGTIDLIWGRTYEARLEEMYLQFVTQAKAWIERNPDADIRMAAIGFSRGAEQAAGFTRLVEERGIRDPVGAELVRDSKGLVESVTYHGAPLREPGSVVQAVGLFDPVGTGTPRDHDRRLAPSVVSGFQINAEDERRNLFQVTRIIDPGVTEDGRFLNVTVAGAHSDIGGSYALDGLSIRSGNLMVDYLTALSDQPFLDKRPEPLDAERNVIHRSEEHQVFYRTSLYDRNGERVAQEELAPEFLCKMDCRDAEPRNEAMAEGLSWQKVEIAPVLTERTLTREEYEEKYLPITELLDAARRGDGDAIGQISRQMLESDQGQAWVEAGKQRQNEQSLAQQAHAPEPVDLAR